MVKQSFIKRALVLMLAMLFTFELVGQSASAGYYYHSSYSYTTGSLWWKETYNVSVYKDSVLQTIIYYGSTSVSTGFDYKGNMRDGITLSQTTSFSIGKQTVATLNSSISVKEFGITAGIGGTLSTTSSMTWGVATSSVRTISASAPIGFYSYNVCLRAAKMSLVGTHKGNIEILAPASQPFRAIVYNRNNASYSGAVLY